MDNSELRKNYLKSKIGDLTAYAGMVGSEFSSKLDRLSQIIGTSHELSVGEYKESLLRNCLKRFIPKRYSVGTGFILFVNDDLRHQGSENIDLSNIKHHTTSHQLDIVIYDEFDHAPLFKDGDFVVLRPESVKSIVEVKGFLDVPSVKSCVNKYITLGKAWEKYSNRYNEYQSIFETNRKLASPGLFLMGWNIRVSKNGKALCTGKSLRENIVKTYRAALSQKELEERRMPLLHSAFIYDDSIVSMMSFLAENDHYFGYSTERGKFVRYGNDNQPYLDRDCTVWKLLTSIYIHLEAPFNPYYHYFDQGTIHDVLPHEYSGMTDLVSGKTIR